MKTNMQQDQLPNNNEHDDEVGLFLAIYEGLNAFVTKHIKNSNLATFVSITISLLIVLSLAVLSFYILFKLFGRFVYS